MTSSNDTFLVTGGAGFIGCNFVHRALRSTDARVIVVDKLTYAGNRASLAAVADDPRYSFVQADIADANVMGEVFAAYGPTRVFNFAAESHVDRSIEGPGAFIQTNIVGTFVLLEAARRLLASGPDGARARFRFVHVSTDEVYGSLGPTGFFTEQTPYAPNSPYAASKAGADHLVRAWCETYRLPALVTNCSNNYGPFQFPEKLVPLMILNALEGRPLPIYGDGRNVRDWLYVDDHCEGILLAAERGKPGEKYNIGGDNERTNIELVDRLCALLDELRPARDNPALSRQSLTTYSALKHFVADRPGHDRRYAIDATRSRSELGWKPAHTFTDGLRRTVEWYLANREWCELVQQGKYRRERLGLDTADNKAP